MILERAYLRVKNGEKVRIILEVPPRNGKTETATIRFPAWVLGNNPDWPVMVASYSSDLAEDFGQKTRDTITSPVYKHIFNTKLRSDTTARGRWMTEEGGLYIATGVGGAISGRGFKLGIIDDPFKNRQEADSPVTRDYVWDWYTSTFYTRQEGHATALVVIATRWNVDDLIGRIKDQEEKARKAKVPHYDQWEVIKFPAIAEEDEYSSIDGRLLRRQGEALWPEKFPLATLENIKNSIGIYDWSSLYQQNPILQADAEFKKEWFKYYEEKDLKGKRLSYKTIVDLAISQSNTADNTVIRTLAKEIDGPNIYLIEETAGKMDPLQTIDAIFYHFQKYRSAVWLETVAYQKALKYFLEEEMRKKQIYFVVNELKRNNMTSKLLRIRGLIPLYKTGVIWHRTSDTELERELLQFPKGKKDDRADTLASALEILENTAPVIPKETPETFDPFKAF